MHRANIAIFLTAVGLIGVAPLLLTLVYLARKRVDRRSGGEASASSRSTLVAVAIATAVLLVAGGSTAWVLSARGAAPTAAMGDMPGMAGTSGGSGLPLLERLGGLPMTSLVTGADAIEQVARLHGSSFRVTDAAIASYANGRATIWVSSAADRETAADQVVAMRERIAEGGTPFAPPHELRGVRGVYGTSGMGQRAFFFSSGDEVWWISVDPGLARDALTQVLEKAR